MVMMLTNMEMVAAVVMSLDLVVLSMSKDIGCFGYVLSEGFENTWGDFSKCVSKSGILLYKLSVLDKSI